MGDFSSFLFANPSLSEGAGRILDFGDNLAEYNRSADDKEADLNAMWSDWLAFAEDLRGEIRSVVKSEPRLRGER